MARIVMVSIRPGTIDGLILEWGRGGMKNPDMLATSLGAVANLQGFPSFLREKLVNITVLPKSRDPIHVP